MHMTLFKKSLALVLAFAMIFSTMSVMGFAANGDTENVEYYTHMNSDGTIGTDDGSNAIDFSYKFFRKVQTAGMETPDKESDDVYKWVETDKAAPGDTVKARFFVGTDYPVYSSISTATLFDARFFSVNYSESSPFTVQTNGSYSNGLNISGNEAGGYKSNPYNYNKLRGDQSYFALPGVVTDGETKTESYYVPSNFFYAEDGKTIAKNLITTTVLLSGKGAAALDSEDWIFELEFVVNDDSYVTTPGNKGFAKTPIEFANHKNITEESRAIGLVDIPEYPLGSTSYYDGIPMGSNDIYASSTPAYLSVFGNVVFDAVTEEGGYFEGKLETSTKSGVIGRDKVDPSGVSPLNDKGKTLLGWSLTKGGEVLSTTDYMGMLYDYDDITLYAVWGESQVNTYYTYEVYQMNPDGTYPEKPFSQRITEKAGEIVKIELTDTPEGFVLDEKKENILDGAVSADNSTILRAYFARKQYKATYHYTDNNGAQKDEIQLYYGQEIPGFTAVEGGIPKVPGKDFIGWSTSETEKVDVPAVMPNKDLNIYPMYTDSVYTFVFDAAEGAFADNSKTKSFVYKYGDTPAEFKEIPVLKGHEFSCWDDELPATVTEDVTFKAIYNASNYTVKFVDSNGNEISKEAFAYNTEITDAYVPDGYKADAWTFENGVAVEFPFNLEEDVTLVAAEDANLYKVTFLVDGEVYDEYKIESGKEVVVPQEDPEDKTGYVFKMWDPDPTSQIVDKEDLVFNAVYVKGEYVLSFNTDGGTPIESITALYGENIKDKLPGANATSKEGYTFIGWDTKLPETMPGEDTEIKAFWSKNVYSVKFVNGLTGAEIKTVTGMFGDAVAVPALPEEAGYTFAWNVTPPTTIPAKDEADKLMANGGVMTVTAVPTANDVTISFDTNGGTPATIDNIGGKAHADITPAITEPTPPEGMKFVGWVDDAGNVVSTPTKFPATSVKLTAKYENLVYTAIYDADGGLFADNTTENKTFKVEYGASVPAPVNPTKNGYKFLGWSPVVTTMPAKDVTFTAQWESIGSVDYTVTVYAVNPADGSYLDPIEITYKADPGAKIQILEKGSVVPSGVTPVWYEDLYTSNTNIPDTENANNILSIEIEAEGENKLVAYFKLAEFTAVFDANGGEFVDAPAGDANYNGSKYTFKGTHGEQIVPPVEPDMEGKEFKGWKDSKTGYIYETQLPAFAGDVEYVAEWETKTYDVTFTITDEEGKTVFEETVTFEHGEDVVAPDYDLPDGYEFDGWDIPDGTKAENAEDSYENSAELVSYAVKYVASTGVPEGAAIPEDTTKTVKDKFAVGTATVPEGYTFEGWFINSESGAKAEAEYQMTAAPVTFYGKFTANTYYVNFDVNGGDYMASIPVIFGSNVDTLPVPTKEGNTFKGWEDKDGNAVTDENGNVLDENFKMPAGDLLLKAAWEENAKYYNVYYTFNIDGIAEAPATEENIAAGTEHTLASAPSDTEEYRFTGWYYNNQKVTKITMPSSDAYIIGIWEPIVGPTFKLTMNANGGKFNDGTEVKERRFAENDKVVGAVEEPTREGYEFAGWSGDLNPDGTMPAEDTVIEATWIAKVTIDPNGGTFADGTTAKIETKGDAINTDGKLPVTKENAEFLCWKDTITGTEYDTIPATSEAPLNLVAQWDEKEQYTITYYVGGNVHKTDSYFEGDSIVLPDAPTVEGFDFGGWKLKDGSDVPATMEEENLEAIAVLNPHKNDVTFYLDAEKTQVYKEYKDVPYGSEIEIPEDPTHPTNPKLVFAGWDPQVESEMPDEDLEYVATWKEVGDKFKAHFVSDGKTVDLFLVSEGAEIPEARTPKKFGYKFVGWEPEVPDVMPAEDLTFEAQWEIDKTFVSVIIGGTVIGGGAIAGIVGTGALIGGSIIGGILVIWGASELAKNTFTVTYKVDGEVYKTYKVLAGTKIPVPADPEKDGSEFAGWNPEVPEKMPKEDLVFEATWNADADVEIPSTGSASGIAALAAISAAAAIAVIATKKKKEEEEE